MSKMDKVPLGLSWQNYVYSVRLAPSAYVQGRSYMFVLGMPFEPIMGKPIPLCETSADRFQSNHLMRTGRDVCMTSPSASFCSSAAA